MSALKAGSCFLKRPPKERQGVFKKRELACVARSGGRLRWHGGGCLVLKFPDEAAQFPGNGDDGFGFVKVARLEPFVAGVEAVLGTPGEFAHLGGLLLLATTELLADFRRMTVVLGALTRHRLTAARPFGARRSAPVQNTYRPSVFFDEHPAGVAMMCSIMDGVKRSPKGEPVTFFRSAKRVENQPQLHTDEIHQTLRRRIQKTRCRYATKFWQTRRPDRP